MKRKLRIALVSTPRVSVPPQKYGGTELIVYNLAEGLVKRGHDVTVFATGDSHVSAKLEYIIQKSGFSQKREGTVAAALLHCEFVFSKIRSLQFDIVHNHYFLWGVAFSRFLKIPVVTTYHGDFATDMREKNDFTKEHFEKLVQKSPFVSISNSQAKKSPVRVHWVGTVYNGIEVEKFDYRGKSKNYFAWIGRISPEKGAYEAICAARSAKVPLVLGGPVNHFHQRETEYFVKKIKPHIDQKQIRYIGEVDHTQKVELLKHARALLNPIQWDEPFGLVMVEAMACGTPVIALKRGSVPEIVLNGKTGFVVKTPQEIKLAIGRIGEIDRAACRARVEKHFSSNAMTVGYEKAYDKILNYEFGG